MLAHFWTAGYHLNCNISISSPAPQHVQSMEELLGELVCPLWRSESWNIMPTFAQKSLEVVVQCPCGWVDEKQQWERLTYQSFIELTFPLLWMTWGKDQVLQFSQRTLPNSDPSRDVSVGKHLVKNFEGVELLLFP